MLVEILPNWKMVTVETYHMRQCQCNVTFMWKVNFEEKNGSSTEKFPSLVLPGNITTVTAPYYPISSVLSVSGRLREVKNKENFKLLALKVVAVAYERWSLTRGSQCSDLAEKLLVFWKTGLWGDVVAYERWSQPEVWLFMDLALVVWMLDHAVHRIDCYQKGSGKRGHIVADTLLPMIFLGLHKRGNICCGHKMFLNKIRNIFCVPDTKFVSATNVAHAGKRGKICVGNNVSATMYMCPRLPGPKQTVFVA